MKKNKMMRLASFLLVAVMLTTSVISGTFAKYVTTGSIEDEARVARFGVTVTATGSLFDKTYFAEDREASNEPAGNQKDNKKGTILTVESSDDKVVAPGTNGNENNPLKLTVTGTPEVDVRVAISIGEDGWQDIFLGKKNGLPDMTGLGETGKFNNPSIYYPIEYTLQQDLGKGDTVLAQGNLETIVKALEGLSGYYNANTDLSKVIGTLTLTWKWKFEADVESVEADARAYWNDNEAELTGDGYEDVEAYVAAMKAAAILLQDQQDTLLGDLAAGTVGIAENLYNLKTGIKITVTVTQVD